jgi:hypothetical protein
MEGVLLRGGGDDGIHFAVEREPDGGLHGVPGEAAGPDGASPVAGGLTAPHPPDTERHPARRRQCADLVLRADQGHLRRERVLEGPRGDLRADAARIAEGDGDAGQGQIRISTYVVLRSWSM